MVIVPVMMGLEEDKELTPEEKQLHQVKMSIKSYEGTIAHKTKRNEDTKEFEALLKKAHAEVKALEKKIAPTK